MDFLDQKNIPYPKYNWSTKEFSDILAKSKSKNTIGVLNANLLRETLPAQFNPKLGWATYSSGKYSFNTGEWVEAVNYVKEIDSKQLTFESFPPEDRKGKFTTDDSLVAFSEGKLAMIMDGTWQLNAIADGKINFKYDFYPLPTKEGNEYSRPAIVSDYLGVSSESANKRAAFEFAKWMSYSAQGYAKKLEIASKGEELFGKKKVVLELPVTNSTESRDKWMQYNKYDIGGIKDMFKNIDKAFVDPMKTVPGYPKSYFETVASQYAKIEAGEFSASDKANEFNQKANQYYDEALQAVNN
jgi:multiple sugar transport system substrate-binding protein